MCFTKYLDLSLLKQEAFKEAKYLGIVDESVISFMDLKQSDVLGSYTDTEIPAYIFTLTLKNQYLISLSLGYFAFSVPGVSVGFSRSSSQPGVHRLLKSL